MGRRVYVGNAGGTTIASDITAVSTSIAVVDATNWPSPSGGTVAVAIINRGNSSEEKITFSGRSGNTLTGCVRGFDSTAAASHVNGETIEHGLSATDMDEANDHVFDTTNDDHSQYLNIARHDVEGRHSFGSALGAPSAAANILLTGTGTTGTGDDAAREDHGHAYVPPSCRVFHNATQAAANGTLIKVAFNSEEYDNGTLHDTAVTNSRITIITAGVYILEYGFAFEAGNDYSRIYGDIFLNNTTNIGGVHDDQGPGTQALVKAVSGSTTKKLAAGDYVEVRAYQTNGPTASRNVLADSASVAPCYFSATWIGVG